LPGRDFGSLKARRLIERFEWDCTSKHGIWLDLSASEPGVLTSCRRDRRIPSEQTLGDEIAAWERDRNAAARRPIGASQVRRPHQTEASPCFNLIERAGSRGFHTKLTACVAANAAGVMV
jgi:hypothetical protein